MRFFELLNFQHLVLALLPTLLFILVFALALRFGHFKGEKDEDRKNRILYRYPEGIEDRAAPFPLAMILIIAGTVLWAFFYILLHGLLGVKI
ncbi:MAG: hypothetical protein RBT11_16050 [Desulfobacterales bacterium]|jgi:hypothetical protein|nr:hypothetical protein [Desulfobacterales bacterium]